MALMRVICYFYIFPLPYLQQNVKEAHLFRNRFQVGQYYFCARHVQGRLDQIWLILEILAVELLARKVNASVQCRKCDMSV